MLCGCTMRLSSNGWYVGGSGERGGNREWVSFLYSIAVVGSRVGIYAQVWSNEVSVKGSEVILLNNGVIQCNRRTSGQIQVITVCSFFVTIYYFYLIINNQSVNHLSSLTKC